MIMFIYRLKIIALICLFIFNDSLKAQDSLTAPVILNTVKNISVTAMTDALLFKDLQSGQLLYKLPVYSPADQLQFSPDGNLLLYSGVAGTTRVYEITADSCTQVAVLPFKTEAVTFSASGNSIFLIHSRSFRGARLSAYDTYSWKRIAERKVPTKTNSLSVNATDSLLGFAAGPVIRLTHTEDFKTEKVYWEAKQQQHLVFNTVEKLQCASVTPKNIIQVRDLAHDMIIAEIGAHDTAITWMAYQPGGSLLASLDGKGHLYIWSPVAGECVLQLDNVHGTPAFDAAGHLHLSSANNRRILKLDGSEAAKPAEQSYFIERKQQSFTIYPQPIISYTPETGMLLGASASFLFFRQPSKDDQHFYRPSAITPVITYGLGGKQLRMGVNTDIFTNNGWHFANNISYNIRERNYFFGIGKNSLRRNRESYTSNTFFLNGSASHFFGRHFNTGLGYNIRHDTPLEFEKETTPLPTGAQGGWVIGIGPVLQLDYRDNIVFPTRGSVLDAGFYRYADWLKSDYEHNEILLNYRNHVPAGFLKKGSVLAFQGLFNATWGGDVPFYRLPYITGDRVLRGVWRNLYIDKQAAAVQAEFRSFIARGDSRYGYVVFAGLADSAEDFFKGYKPDIKFVYGAGWRQQLVPKLRLDLRIDVAFTNKGNVGVSGGAGVAF